MARRSRVFHGFDGPILRNPLETPFRPAPTTPEKPPKAPKKGKGGKRITAAAPSTPTPAPKKVNGRLSKGNPSGKTAVKKVVPLFTCIAWGFDPELNLRRMKGKKSSWNAYQASLIKAMEVHGPRVTRSAARQGQKIWLMEEQRNREDSVKSESSGCA